MHWKKATIIGVGLLGGSVGMALRQRQLADCVCGFVRRAKSIEECRQAGAADVATNDLREAVTGADLIVVCTPVAQMRPVCEQMIPFVKRGCVITDVGSVKAKVLQELERLARRAGAHFVGGHPMAGSEQTGVGAARPDLFGGAICVVTPTRKSNRAAVRAVEQLWQALGAEVLRLTPEQHDKLVSRTSHLPYFTAAALAHLVLDPSGPANQGRLCATGFRDATRIASGSPEMWRDIAVSNRQEIARAMARLIRDLQNMRRVILEGKASSLEKWLREAKDRRDRWRSGPAGVRA